MVKTELTSYQYLQTICFTNGPGYWPEVSNQLIFPAHFDTDEQVYSAIL